MVESVVLCCPECGNSRVFKDGLRYLNDGSQTQRWLCRNCFYRFSEPKIKLNVIGQVLKGSNPRQNHADRVITRCDLTGKEAFNSLFFNGSEDISSHNVTILEKRLNPLRIYNSEYRVGDSKGESKNLATAIELKAVGESPKTEQTEKGKIVEYLWYLKREGRSPHTITAHRKVLTRLAKHGANLFDPESVKDTISNEQVHINTKVHYVGVYKTSAEWLNLAWKPPKYKSLQKIPWIPTETELDQLIAGFKKKTATFLMTLKETMARSGEVWALKWIDLNGNVLTISTPEKGSNPRQIKISDRLVSLLNAMPRKDVRIFGPAANLQNFRGNFTKRRRYLAKKLGNPRINQITFHTFRHWGATMLYHKTKDILYVQKQLGHRNIESTMIYTQLISFEGDEYAHQVAKTIEEAGKLVDAGFEYVCNYGEEGKLFRKRK